MSEISQRYRNVAAAFSERAAAVPDGAWDNAAPCDGWVARDVVRHLVDWMPGFISARASLAFPAGPSVDDQPVRAWSIVSDSIQAALDDPAIATREYDAPEGRSTLEHDVDGYFIGDILLHTWDLARATGQDERLDPDEVHRQLEAMAPYEDAMRKSGHYGPRVEVPADADEQTRLIAFVGRDPNPTV
jgi:uncharacterized protein (TIGR03086 family)